MAKFEIKMPKLGESITEGTIIQWNIKAGDVVKEDDVLFEVSTAKVSAEIPSPVAGKIVELLFSEGDVVPVGVVVAIVELEGDAENETDERTEENQPALEKQVIEVQEKEVVSEPLKDAIKNEPEKKVEKQDNQWFSPVVLRLAQEAQVSQEELNALQGTGYEGRVSKKDIEHYIEQKKKGNASIAKDSEKVSGTSASVDTSAQTSASVSQQKIPSAKETIIETKEGDQVVEMDYVRRLIADHMVMSKKVSPHVTTIVEADVTNLVRWRDRVKDDFFHKEGVKLTFMPAIVEATAKALAEFPQVNASVDGYKMILKKHINVGVAVALDSGNLIVPVIKNANQLNINGLAVAIDSLATKARKNKLALDDIEEGTFTITNFGTFKNIIGTPIINQPQVAILGVGFIEKKPAVLETPDGDVIAIRHKVYLSLSYDHRIIDGSLGGAFVRKIADYLENWGI